MVAWSLCDFLSRAFSKQKGSYDQLTSCEVNVDRHNRQTHQTDRQTNKPLYGKTERQTDKQVFQQAERQKNREDGRQKKVKN